MAIDKIKKIRLSSVPSKNIKDGLMVIFSHDTKTETNLSFRDVLKGQRIYDYPTDPREVLSIYLKIK